MRHSISVDDDKITQHGTRPIVSSLKGYARCMMAPPSHSFPRCSISVAPHPIARGLPNKKERVFRPISPIPPIPLLTSVPWFVSFGPSLHRLRAALADSTPFPLSRPLRHPPSSLHRRAAWRLHFVYVWVFRPAVRSMEVEIPALPPPLLGIQRQIPPSPSPPSGSVVWDCWPCTCLRLGLPTSNPEARGRGIRYKRDALEKWAGVTPRTIVCLSSLTLGSIPLWRSVF